MNTTDWMKKENRPVLGGKEIWPPFTIPSGIITVLPDIIERVAETVPIGLITTKSVGKDPYQGYETPIISQKEGASLSTAVGLSTAGYREWAKEMESIYPLENSFLLTSIFGETVDDFIEIAKGLSHVTDGFELNFCCPHSLCFGEAVGRQKELTGQITAAVREVWNGVLAVKLSPNVEDIGDWAKQLVNAGADVISAIGPTTAVSVEHEYAGQEILSYGKGGLSGPAILERGIECVREIREHVDVAIIAGGGIRSAGDVQRYREAGGNMFSVGTTLAGCDTANLARYFRSLLSDLTSGTDTAAAFTFGGKNLNQEPFTVSKNYTCGQYTVLEFDRGIDAEPGQFVFAWIPGISEKPFSLAGKDPLVLAIRPAGHLSKELCKLKEGENLLIRGPYGRPFPLRDKSILVGGGCGIAPLRFFAAENKVEAVVLGARTGDDLLFEHDFPDDVIVVTATDDGSKGIQGTAVDALKTLPVDLLKGASFFNCGPEIMIASAAEVEREWTSRENILVCVERHTACGIGLCGKCDMDGYRTCVDGPVFELSELPEDTDLGRRKREASGKRIGQV